MCCLIHWEGQKLLKLMCVYVVRFGQNTKFQNQRVKWEYGLQVWSGLLCANQYVCMQKESQNGRQSIWS